MGTNRKGITGNRVSLKREIKRIVCCGFREVMWESRNDER